MCAVAVRREFFPAVKAAEVQNRRVPNWRQLSSLGYRFGATDGAVQIVEFSDFQCPYCAEAQPILAGILARHPQVSLIYRHFPLRATHPLAVEAANAAECAGDQGRFAAYHNALFAMSDSLGGPTWENIARRTGVPDVERFSACVHSMRHRDRVEADERVADSLGLLGTPTLIINGEVLQGAVTTKTLEAALSRAAR
jgi:protein-disulfide isomerase